MSIVPARYFPFLPVLIQSAPIRAYFSRCTGAACRFFAVPFLRGIANLSVTNVERICATSAAGIPAAPLARLQSETRRFRLFLVETHANRFNRFGQRLDDFVALF